MEIKITFPGGKKVDADVGGMLVRTGRPVKYGGNGTAPSPFEHFMASIGTCAGIFVMGFCQQRNIPAAGCAFIISAIPPVIITQPAQAFIQANGVCRGICLYY